MNSTGSTSNKALDFIAALTDDERRQLIVKLEPGNFKHIQERTILRWKHSYKGLCDYLKTFNPDLEAWWDGWVASFDVVSEQGIVVLTLTRNGPIDMPDRERQVRFELSQLPDL